MKDSHRRHLRCHRRTVFLLCAVFAALRLCGCALPRPAPKSFVSDREQLAAELGSVAMVDFGAGRYTDALLGFEQVLYLFPDSETASFNLANTLTKLGLYERAEELLRDLEGRHPTYPQYKSALANLYFEKGDFETALKAYEAVAAFAGMLDESPAGDPRKAEGMALRADALRSISVIYFLQGKEMAALCASNDALLVRFLRADILRHARLLLALNRVEEADVFLSGYMRNDGAKDGYALHLLSLIRIAEGRYDDAFEANRRADMASQGNEELDFEIRLVRAVLFDLSDKAKKDFESSSAQDHEEKEELRLTERATVLGDSRLGGEESLYWPNRFVAIVNRAVEDERVRQEKENGDFLWF